MEWHTAIEILTLHVFRVTTPEGSGTGVLISNGRNTELCAIATAAHVIDHAHYWEEPLRLEHTASGKSVLLKADQRVINLNEARDTAAILFNRGDLPIPPDPLPLVPAQSYLKPGNEIGWVGFPAIQRTRLCFFSGRISAWSEEEAAYFVDGVAINGVSGGPALTLGSGPVLVGLVSAYIPNRATGETLPGLSVVRSVEPFHDLAQIFANLDQAKKVETPPTEPPPPSSDTNQTRSAG